MGESGNGKKGMMEMWGTGNERNTLEWKTKTKVYKIQFSLLAEFKKKNKIRILMKF